MDKRLIKEYTQLNHYTVDDLKKIIPVVYSTKNNQKGIGIIAQELENICPFLVSEKDPKQVDYSKVSLLLFNIIIELDEKIKSLEQKMKKANGRNSSNK